jgi:DNA helicase II / ATP-dependent DNA helicase PcrA
MADINDILSGLTVPHREAVLHQGNALLIGAGPGSGKTEVIARRVAYLVQSDLVKPAHVLAVTFTEKAALVFNDRTVSASWMPPVNSCWSIPTGSCWA